MADELVMMLTVLVGLMVALVTRYTHLKAEAASAALDKFRALDAKPVLTPTPVAYDPNLAALGLITPRFIEVFDRYRYSHDILQAMADRDWLIEVARMGYPTPEYIKGPRWSEDMVPIELFRTELVWEWADPTLPIPAGIAPPARPSAIVRRSW